jgi:hypothetical protein
MISTFHLRSYCYQHVSSLLKCFLRTVSPASEDNKKLLPDPSDRPLTGANIYTGLFGNTLKKRVRERVSNAENIPRSFPEIFIDLETKK